MECLVCGGSININGYCNGCDRYYVGEETFDEIWESGGFPTDMEDGSEDGYRVIDEEDLDEETMQDINGAEDIDLDYGAIDLDTFLKDNWENG